MGIGVKVETYVVQFSKIHISRKYYVYIYLPIALIASLHSYLVNKFSTLKLCRMKIHGGTP